MGRAFAWLAPPALLLLLGAGYLRACTGPRPEVVSAWIEPLAGGVRAVASVRNDGGEGQVQVDFRVVDARSGRTYARQESSPVERGERTEISTWIAAPPGEYRVEAKAEYPPR